MSKVSATLFDFDTLERISTLLWAYRGDSEMAAKIAMVRLFNDLYGKLSGQSEIEELRTATILKIATYVKEHPKASKEELSKAIGVEITAFAEKLKKL